MGSMPFRLIALLVHAYVAWRIAPALGSLPAAVAFVALLAVSALTLPFAFTRRRGTAGKSTQWLAWTGLVCMGLFSSLFVLTVLRDLGLLAVAVADAGWPGHAALGGFATFSARAVPITAALVTLWGFANARRTARLVRVDVPVAGLPEALQGFTIAQISDVHVGPTIRRNYLERVVAAVNRLDADVVAITGDLVDGSVGELAEHVAPLATLRSREGSYFVTGNHEYYSGAAAWVNELRRLGVGVLMNQHVVIRRGSAELVLAGVTDYGAGQFDHGQASDPKAALAGSPSEAALRVLLAHQPRSAAAAAAAGFDLQLSGHTHGGQFLPWNFLVRLQQPFTAGLHRWKQMWVYTSRGTGYWGPPKRFGAPSEITLLRLVAARAGGKPRFVRPPRPGEVAASAPR